MAFTLPKPIDITKYKLRNKGVTFDDATHTYTIDGEKCLSVSSIISKYKEDFPLEQVLPKMVKKYTGTTKETWKTLFNLKRERNTYQGKSLHSFAESEFVRPGYLEPITQQEVSLLKAIDKLEAAGWIPVAAENFNVSKKYLLGYTFDILFYNAELKKFAVGDYKQNEFMTAEQYKGMKGYLPKLMLKPFGDLGFRDVTEFSVAI